MLRKPVAVLSVLVVVLAACDGGGGSTMRPVRTPLSSPTRADSLVIALVGTVSGPLSWRGTDALEGADVAVGALNRRRKRTERPYELVTFDDRGDPDEATALVEQVAADERTVGVVYAGPPEGLPPAEESLAEAGIPALLIHGDLYANRALSPHVFQVSPSYVWEARRIASYLLKDRRYRRVAAIVADTYDGRGAAAAIRNGLRLYGSDPAVVRTYGETSEVEDVLYEMRSRRVEVLIVHGAPSGVGDLLRALDDLDAVYRTTAAARTISAPRALRKKGFGDRRWRPQIALLDGGMSPEVDPQPPPGTVVAETYGRGAHLLPVPALRRFRRAFVGWWDQEPLGWEQRGYEAVLALGWAVHRSGTARDVAETLEGLRGRRFAGLDVTLGPDDHTFVGSTTVGLWVVPEPGEGAGPAPPAGFSWVPLARGFSIDGETTDILERDWKHLFRDPPPPGAPAPKFSRMRFGITSSRRDPIH